jgi:hypothetical protein
MLSSLLTPLNGLLAALGAFTAFYITMWWSAVTKSKPSETALELGTGFVTNFFDTLGIGSFAPTTAIFKFAKIVPDRLIPGTLNVGHTLPTITQAFIYTAAIEVDPKTLILMIGAAVVGAWLGAGIVASWPKRNIQIGMGFALLVAAGLFAWRNLGGSGTETGTIDLQGLNLVIGLVGNFILGALMTLGIGMYAPCMILVGLLGMNAKGRVPDHDGFLRVPHADEQREVRAEGRLLAPPRARPRPRRRSGRAHRRTHREGNEHLLRPLARGGGRRHCRLDDASLGS